MPHEPLFHSQEASFSSPIRRKLFATLSIIVIVITFILQKEVYMVKTTHKVLSVHLLEYYGKLKNQNILSAHNIISKLQRLLYILRLSLEIINKHCLTLSLPAVTFDVC